MSDKDTSEIEIIEKIYDVAVDPARLEELVDVWEARIAPLRMQHVQHDDDNDPTFTHFTRMSLFLDRIQFSEPKDIMDPSNEANSLATILVSSDLTINYINSAGVDKFNLKLGNKFDGVFSDPDSQEALVHAVLDTTNNPDSPPQFLRFRVKKDQRFIVVRVQSFKENYQSSDLNEVVNPRHGLQSKDKFFNPKTKKLVLIITTEVAWQPSFGDAIQGAFGLSVSEVEIVKALIAGYTIEAIAAERSRSKATVRTQIRSIFEKTQTRSQAELIRISLSLMDMATIASDVTTQKSIDVFSASSLTPSLYLSIKRSKNRRLDHIIIGDPDGAPILYAAGSYGFIRWPAKAEAMAKAKNMKVIVPIRAGFGHSGPFPAKTDYAKATIEDYTALLDHYDIESCPVMSQGGDFCFATMFAARYPERVSVLIANAPMMPLWKKEQFEKMDKWYKFIIANARYAPKILPYLVKAGFYLALSSGQRGFMKSIYSNSPADLNTFADPEIFEAIVIGTEITLSRSHTAHESFAQDVIIQSSSDWIVDLESLKDKVPVHVHMGTKSPMLPAEILPEVLERYNWVNFHMVPDAAELLFFKHWALILDFLQPFLNKDNG